MADTLTRKGAVNPAPSNRPAAAANATQARVPVPAKQGTNLLPDGQVVPADIKLDVSAQLLVVHAGLYSLELTAPRTQRTDTGMVLPCARLDALPGSAAEVHIASLSASNLLLPGSHPSFMRVTGNASVLLTIYKLGGSSPSPELRISYVGPAGGLYDKPASDPSDAMPSLPLTVTIHVERHGDMLSVGGLWAAAPDSEDTIEGFSIRPGEGLPPDCLEYQAILGIDWASPWTGPGEFCGSRGLALPLLGFRVRMRPPYGATHTATIWGRFAKAGEVGPLHDGAACEVQGDALVGMRVVVGERAASPDPNTQASEAKRKKSPRTK